jgi:hypothetical protein
MPVNTFVGRENELRQLQHFLNEAQAGHGQVTFVVGEAGAGKSALVGEFVRRMQENDPHLIAAVGHCNAQTGAGDAYLPFREVLTTLSLAPDDKQTANTVNPANAARLKEFVRVSAETLLAVGPDLIGIFVPGASLLTKIATTAASKTKMADKLAGQFGKKDERGEAVEIDAGLDQEKIFQEYTDVLRALAQSHTLVLILDDLHWADNGSVNLLFHLARALLDSRVLIIGTYRPDDVALGRNGQRHPLEPVINELKRYQGTILIDLGEARASEGRAFVDALIDAEPNRLDATFRQDLFTQTEGHPLFTVEMVRNLQERGELVKDPEGRWVQNGTLDWDALPARVEGVIEERIARLAGDLRETLNIGSVVGYDFAAQVVARVEQAQERELLKQLSQELDKRHGLVEEEGETRVGNRFLSAYRFSHVLFQQFLYNDLAQGERRILHGDVAEALEELYAGYTGPIAVQLARHYTEAGDDAKAAECHIRAGDESVRVFAAAEARLHYLLAIELLERLPDTAETRRTRFETLVKYATIALGAEDIRPLFARLLEAEALGTRLLEENIPSDRLNLAHLRYEIGRAYYTLGDPYEGFAYCEKVMEDATALGDQGLYAWADGLKGVGLQDQGYFAQALVRLPPAVSYLESTQNWRDWAWMSMNMAFALAEHGEYARALEIGESVKQRSDVTKDYWMRCVTHLYHAAIHWVGGDASRSLAEARILEQLAVEGHEEVFIQLGTLPQMLAESMLGDHAAAARTLAYRQELIERIGVEIVYPDWAAAARAEMALNVGQPADAIRLAEQAIKLARQMGGKLAEGLAERTWGAALAASDPPQPDEAERHFVASLQAFEPGEARLEAARTHLAWGKLLQARGQEAAAREHLEKAGAQFEASGLQRQPEAARA